MLVDRSGDTQSVWLTLSWPAASRKVYIEGKRRDVARMEVDDDGEKLKARSTG